ncbi:hypothetical protein [Kordiimonas aquimaris]|uniref:hypothetical protein n=1 Tax=Kordiimonas aquimaris TaxID=707591 RepID=UPI0021D370BA|nr:hypothetical protein [Kordiimonas aquimaris]
MKPFSHFVGIDWTGAKGKRHKGLKIAICEAGTHAPVIVPPKSGYKDWSRRECAEWLSEGAGLPSGSRVLVGIDAAFGYPFDTDKGYLRGDLDLKSAPCLWDEIARKCDGDEDFFGGSFVQAHARHYRTQRYDIASKKFDTVVDKQFFRPELRDCEQICIKEKYGPCESVFNLIGASQVGKSALSTMIMLNQLRSHKDICVWPFDNIGNQQLVLVEIYAALFSKLGGHKGKVRNKDTLNAVFAELMTQPYQFDLPLQRVDDETDALVTAAGLRFIAHDRKYWHPPKLSTKVRRTEGWIFGVV